MVQSWFFYVLCIFVKDTELLLVLRIRSPTNLIASCVVFIRHQIIRNVLNDCTPAVLWVHP